MEESHVALDPPEGEYLVVERLPEIFQGRYGEIPERIYVRDSYRELYDIASDLIVSGKMRKGVTLFTGTPGIGKSMFLIYFIYRFLRDDRLMDKRFAVEFEKGFYYCFEPTEVAGDFRCSYQNGGGIPSKDFLLLCDISDEAQPVSRAKWTFIFSSPNPVRYKEIMKNDPNYKYIMPTWSERELEFVNPNISQWYDAFALFGGVPRHVFAKKSLADLTVLLNDTLEQKGPLIAKSFFIQGFGTIDFLQNEMLMHVNPAVDSDGNFKYDGAAEYTFASNYIFEWIGKRYRHQVLAAAASVFNRRVAADT